MGQFSMEKSASPGSVLRGNQHSAGTQQVSENIVGITQAASDSSAAASQVLSAARDLKQQSGRLRAEMTQFLQTVRAG